MFLIRFGDMSKTALYIMYIDSGCVGIADLLSSEFYIGGVHEVSESTISDGKAFRRDERSCHRACETGADRFGWRKSGRVGP
jgi:hypothetical protein